jgi:hypothetical protein
MRTALRIALPVTALSAIAAGIAVHASAGSDSSASSLPAAASNTASPQALAAVKHAASETLTQSATFSMSLTGATVFGSASSATATGSFDFRNLGGVSSVAVAGGVAEKRAIYGTDAVYTRPASKTSLPPGKSWIVAHFADATELGRNFPQFVGQVESLNPGLPITELALGATSAVAARDETVNGMAATRYDVTVDLRQALARATQPAQAAYALALQSGIAQLAGSATGDPNSAASAAVTMHVWVTRAGQLVHVEFTPTTTGIGAITMTLSGYGTTVPRDAPPADQVVDLTLVSPSGERENRNGGDSDGA